MNKQSPFSKLNEIHYRIIPEKITCTQRTLESEAEYLVYLEKGMQIVGKSTRVKVPKGYKMAKFPVGKNLFDFQILNQKNLTFTWSFYKVDQENYEERIGEKDFEIKEFIEKYKALPTSNNFLKTVQITKDVSITFRVLVQNTADLIMDLTSAILPEVPKELKSELGSEISKTGSEVKKSQMLESESNSKIQKKQRQSSQANHQEIPEMGDLEESPKKITDFSVKNQSQMGLSMQLDEANLTSLDGTSKLSNPQNVLKSYSKGPPPVNIQPTRPKSPHKTNKPIVPTPAMNSPSETQQEVNKSYKKEIQKQQKVKKYKKYAIILIITLLIMGFVSHAFFPEEEEKKSSKKKRKRKQNN